MNTKNKQTTPRAPYTLTRKPDLKAIDLIEATYKSVGVFKRQDVKRIIEEYNAIQHEAVFGQRKSIQLPLLGILVPTDTGIAFRPTCKAEKLKVGG